MKTSDLDRRVKVLEPFKAKDADGVTVQDYYDRGTIWANFKHRASSESFQAARMEAKNPATVAVRASSLTQRITSEWRLETGDMLYDVQGDPYLTDDRALLVIQVEGTRK